MSLSMALQTLLTSFFSKFVFSSCLLPRDSSFLQCVKLLTIWLGPSNHLQKFDQFPNKVMHEELKEIILHT